MAAGDYKSCDVCGGKVFYDAKLNYGDADRPPYRVAGVDQYGDQKMGEMYGVTLDYVGDWAVICTDCSPNFRTVIVPISPPAEPSSVLLHPSGER